MLSGVDDSRCFRFLWGWSCRGWCGGADCSTTRPIPGWLTRLARWGTPGTAPPNQLSGSPVRFRTQTENHQRVAQQASCLGAAQASPFERVHSESALKRRGHRLQSRLSDRADSSRYPRPRRHQPRNCLFLERHHRGTYHRVSCLRSRHQVRRQRQ